MNIDKDKLKRIKDNQDNKGKDVNRSNTSNSGNQPNTLNFDKGTKYQNPNLSNRRSNSNPHNFRQSID